ncbi:exosome complex component RRP45A-like isoform X3 [Coffea eugenioides]|uniref:exosome complex component RRP45A-like isoform X3 n=1 Tax=Coffea eugenioides TaxID=49369 RepID=UPI000F60B95A|nr:exosome complex component RRP45A-like isoform X3 [Coffea eugenioides]
MEQRLANTWRMTVNEKKFIETALHSDLRIDGRRPFDYRELTVKFGREDGSSEVQLGLTHVMGFVSSQLVQPYRDRPNEGTLSVYTELSPMADPSFEAGRPTESAVELGRVIDRGLRESRAVDTESLCVVSGKFVWSIRIDLHILDNGGNLVDAANIAALAALLTFRRPECSLGGEDGQEVIVHPPEVIDPTHFEEGVMGGRLTATLNANGDVCAIQKAGGDGVMQSVIMQCLRIASVKAADITAKIRKAVDSYNTERALSKIRRQPASVAVQVTEPNQIEVKDFLSKHKEKLMLKSEEGGASHSDDMEIEAQSSEQDKSRRRDSTSKSFVGGPLSWDPYSKGVDFEELQASIASRVKVAPVEKLEKSRSDEPYKGESPKLLADSSTSLLSDEKAATGLQIEKEKTLKDAVKPKHKRKKKASTNTDAS